MNLCYKKDINMKVAKGEVPHRAGWNATLCKWYANEVFESNSTFRKSHNRLLSLSSANQIRPCFWREIWKVEFKNQKSHSHFGAFQTVGKAPTSLSWRIRAESTFPICKWVNSHFLICIKSKATSGKSNATFLKSHSTYLKSNA